MDFLVFFLLVPLSFLLLTKCCLVVDIRLEDLAKVKKTFPLKRKAQAIVSTSKKVKFMEAILGEALVKQAIMAMAKFIFVTA